MNDALLLFLSEYITHIDPSVYLKPFDLKRKTPTFRVIQAISSAALTANKEATKSDGKHAHVDDQEKLLLRKRHKSTGHEAYTTAAVTSAESDSMDQLSNKGSQMSVLKLNKAALQTKLGHLLASLSIRDENQLNSFILGEIYFVLIFRFNMIFKCSFFKRISATIYLTTMITKTPLSTSANPFVRSTTAVSLIR